MRNLLLPLVLLASLLATPALAQRSESYGPYELHFNALPSGRLAPEIAQEYGVFRSRGRGVLLVAVLEEGEPRHAIVRVTATDANGREAPVEMRRLLQGERVSYLGSFPIQHGTTMRFRLEVIPQGSGQVLHAAFSQHFYVD